jgi:hypothetical protein
MTHSPGIETVHNGNMGRKKREGNHSPSKNKLVQDLEQSEENGYSDQDSNKAKMNYTKEPNEVQRTS